MNRTAAVLAGATLLLSQLADADVPKGWSPNGTALSDYIVAIDPAVTYQGHPSVSTRSKSEQPPGFAGLMQSSAADDYRGKRVRVTAYLKTRGVEVDGAHGARLWFRIDGPERKMLGFANTDSQPLAPNADWTRCELVLDVPREGEWLNYGFTLAGGGEVWAADFHIEAVGNDVPTTRATNALPLHPTNLDFDQ